MSSPTVIELTNLASAVQSGLPMQLIVHDRFNLNRTNSNVLAELISAICAARIHVISKHSDISLLVQLY